jgi:hypothetical protein
MTTGISRVVGIALLSCRTSSRLLIWPYEDFR